MVVVHINILDLLIHTSRQIRQRIRLHDGRTDRVGIQRRISKGELNRSARILSRKAVLLVYPISSIEAQTKQAVLAVFPNIAEQFAVFVPLSYEKSNLPKVSGSKCL